MIIYKRDQIVSSYDNFKVGEEFFLMGLKSAESRDLVVNEWIWRMKESRTVCTDRGYQANACMTIDCYRDSLKALLDAPIDSDFHNAVVLKIGFYYIITYTVLAGNKTVVDIVSIISEITDIDKKNHMAKLKVVEIYSHNNSVLKTEKFSFVLDHIYAKNIVYDLDEYAPHFAINRSRNYGVGLFLREDDELVSYDPVGKRLILHKDSDENVDSEGNLASGLILRYYYDNKFGNNTSVFVDGRSALLFEKDCKEYRLDKSSMDIIKKYELVEYTTKSGFKFIGYEFGGGIKALYYSYKDFSAIQLNKHEVDFIVGSEKL